MTFRHVNTNYNYIRCMFASNNHHSVEVLTSIILYICNKCFDTVTIFNHITMVVVMKFPHVIDHFERHMHTMQKIPQQ